LGKQINDNVFELEQINGEILNNANVNQLKHFHLKPDWAQDSEGELPTENESDIESDCESEPEDNEEISPLPGIQTPDIANELFEIDHAEVIPDIQSQPPQMSLRKRADLKKPLRFRDDEC
jgi:hypothetical protein